MVAVMLLPVAASFDFTVKVHAATQNQQNIVARADYMYNITWVCKKTVSGWKGNYTYYEGSTYRIPYAWPVTAGKWVPYGISVENFLAATADPNSDFYTKQSYYSGNTGSYSTYYGNDCSTFVSFCWGLSTRQTTSSLPNVSTLIGNVTTDNVNSKLQLGDALDYSGSHVVLVTDIVYNSSGAITSIEITEQTPPQLKRSTYTVSSLVSKYGSKYKIYRYTGTVAAAPDAPSTPSISIDPDDYTVPTTDISYTAGGTMPSGSEVYWVQAVLYNLGYDIDVDGKFGGGSSGTVAQFQSDFGLASNGVVNAETRAMLVKCWTNNRGYYTVTASSLNIRAGAGTSYDKVTSATNGQQVSVIGFNADKSWANVIVNGVVGWCSMQYLRFDKLFDYTVSYNPDRSDAAGPMTSAKQKAYSQYTVLGSDVTASGATLKGWYLFRASDTSWYVDGTGWVADANIDSYTRKLFAPGAKFSLDESVLNMATGDDEYILYGVWEAKEIALGVYKVTAGNLNMRADSNASSDIITVLANGDEVQVIGYNEARTWVNITLGQYKGWVNVKYLEYVRDFQYTVNYSADLEGASVPASVVLAKNGTTSVAGATAEGYTLDGWYVQRDSDKAWWNGSGWTADEASKALMMPGASFGATDANIAAAGDDSFTFHGEWSSAVPEGDVNGDGDVNARDSIIIRKYLAAARGLSDEEFERADINGDGKVNSKDSLAIRRIIAGV